MNRREEVKTLEGHKKSVAALSYFPQGNELASVAMDNSLIIWDLNTGNPRTTLWGGADDRFTGVVVTGEEPLIVGALGDGSLRIWSPQ